MQIQLASDIHLEFPQDQDKTIDELGDSDILVLAGDVHLARFLDETKRIFRKFLKRHKHVVFVPGNHEYYRSDRIDADNVMDAAFKELEPEGFHLLRTGQTCTIDGQRFVGDTMWYPDLRPVKMYSNMLSDFYVIGNYYPWCVERNAAFRNWLPTVLQPTDIVVTHHLPSPRSIPPIYAGRPANCYYLSDMERYISEHKPKLWVHGHTHNACDYKIGDTRIVCNPHGYPNEGKPFNPRLMLEI